jgi:5-methyltetrahydropteroyltriglutamate--homocysteine methyltransferase
VAGQVIDRERLAVGTQCGFSTSVVGNRITVEGERRKLEVIARTAARLWRSG